MKETFPIGAGGPMPVGSGGNLPGGSGGPLPGSYAGGQALLPGLSSLAVSEWPRPDRGGPDRGGQGRPPPPVRPPGPVTPGMSVRVDGIMQAVFHKEI